MRRLAAVIVVGGSLIAGAGQAEEADDLPCLDIEAIDHTEIVDNESILFYMKDGAVWQNELLEPCGSLKKMDGFEYTGVDTKLCSNIAIIRALGKEPACALGLFVPYVPAKSP